ncbi:hypothetical protein [Roseateles sp. P5_E7]
MWPRRFTAALALVAAGVGGLPPAAAAGEAVAVERITWLFGNTLSQSPTSGIARPADDLLAWLERRLPQVGHERRMANAKRTWALIESGEPVCAASAVRQPARERQAHFSNTGLMPPPQLIVRQSRVAELPRDDAGHVDLIRLVRQQRWHGAVVQGRSYGAELDAQLAALLGSDTLHRYSSGDFGSNILPMLLQSRADFTVEYANALLLVAATYPEAAQFVALPIAHAAAPITVGVACPRTPWGRAAIQLVDAALGTPEGSAMLRALLEEGLPAQTRREYAAQFDAFFAARSRPGRF